MSGNNGLVSVVDLRETTGVSFRQIHYWVQKGWVVSSRERATRGATGQHMFTAREARIVELMMALTHAGLTAQRAAVLARARTEGRQRRFPLNDTVTLTLR